MLNVQSVGRKESRSIADPYKAEINVLVVDDDLDDYRAISRLLSQLDEYAVKTTRASSGLAARKGIASNRYDVAMVDYRLGRETGIDVIKSMIRHQAVAAPILVSGNLSPEVQRAALNAGAFHCIDKDYLTAKILETTIRSAIHAAFWDTAPVPARAERRPEWLH